MQIGRKVLTTYEPVITEKNVISILQKVMPQHLENANRITFLDNYEKGYQPIIREKKYRPDIDVQTNDNVANEVTNFKTSFHWGSPITFVQKENGFETDENITKAIAMLNAYYEAENIRTKTQHLGRNVEIACRGYTFIDVNTDEQEIAEGGSPFKIESLEPVKVNELVQLRENGDVEQAKKELVKQVSDENDQKGVEEVLLAVFLQEENYKQKNVGSRQKGYELDL